MAAGVSFVHVPFKGDSESTAALLGGHVKTIVSTNGVLSFMESGKVRALAVTSDKRHFQVPEVPTEPVDQPLDAIITEEGVLTFG